MAAINSRQCQLHIHDYVISQVHRSKKKKPLHIFVIYVIGTWHMSVVDGFACHDFTVSSPHMNRTRAWAIREELTSLHIDSKSGTVTVWFRIIATTTTVLDLCFIFSKRFGLLAGLKFRGRFRILIFTTIVSRTTLGPMSVPICIYRE
jgi:hypothetical protein